MFFFFKFQKKKKNHVLIETKLNLGDRTKRGLNLEDRIETIKSYKTELKFKNFEY